MRSAPGLRTAALSLVAACLLTTAAQAVPVALSVNTGANGGFRYSFLHSATSSCETISGIEFCKNGSSLFEAGGSLTADLTGQVLSNITGTITVAGGPDIVVIDGGFDFASAAPDTFAGSLVTSTHGTFWFLNHLFAPSANTFDGVDLFVWGNNWDNQGTPDPGPFPNWGLDLGIGVILPEPGTASLLFGSALVWGWARRGRF